MKYLRNDKFRYHDTKMLSTQGTVLCVDMAVIICYFVTGDVYAKDCQAKK